MDRQTDKILRRQLVSHLYGNEAFTPVDSLLKKIPFEETGIIPDKLPYSFYQQFYHLRLTQYDILEFSRNPDYSSPAWPQGYWPESPAPESQQEWRQLTEAFYKERDEFCDYILNPGNNLYQPIRHGSGQTLLREALLVTEHTAYHTGQLWIILRLLDLY